MGLTINDDRMYSKDKDTPHTAIRHGDYWEVSWLPGKTRPQRGDHGYDAGLGGGPLSGPA